jgi:hypothetical protein
VLISITGDCPGVISVATAVLMTTLVRDHSLEYLLATTILAGVIQYEGKGDRHEVLRTHAVVLAFGVAAASMRLATSCSRVGDRSEQSKG